MIWLIRSVATSRSLRWLFCDCRRSRSNASAAVQRCCIMSMPRAWSMTVRELRAASSWLIRDSVLLAAGHQPQRHPRLSGELLVLGALRLSEHPGLLEGVDVHRGQGRPAGGHRQADRGPQAVLPSACGVDRPPRFRRGIHAFDHLPGVQRLQARAAAVVVLRLVEQLGPFVAGRHGEHRPLVAGRDPARGARQHRRRQRGQVLQESVHLRQAQHQRLQAVEGPAQLVRRRRQITVLFGHGQTIPARWGRIGVHRRRQD